MDSPFLGITIGLAFIGGFAAIILYAFRDAPSAQVENGRREDSFAGRVFTSPGLRSREGEARLLTLPAQNAEPGVITGPRAAGEAVHGASPATIAKVDADCAATRTLVEHAARCSRLFGPADRWSLNDCGIDEIPKHLAAVRGVS